MTLGPTRKESSSEEESKSLRRKGWVDFFFEAAFDCVVVGSEFLVDFLSSLNLKFLSCLFLVPFPSVGASVPLDFCSCWVVAGFVDCEELTTGSRTRRAALFPFDSAARSGC